ncbi:hypothetical protein AJ79_08233 [Helicocarpus griseus UAMH5409]|uniref:Uncharacterized protein n=1 Tax=Helicocarpus griseus UAMH5409 TaxID=1447875 RepID=A0A2B7WV59_9EURO|nr:hypothetical protein AJ79_08233 [Helicocarpus griseus UAMH5409]
MNDAEAAAAVLHNEICKHPADAHCGLGLYKILPLPNPFHPYILHHFFLEAGQVRTRKLFEAGIPSRCPLTWRISSDGIIMHKVIPPGVSRDVAILYTHRHELPQLCANCASGNRPFKFCMLPPYSLSQDGQNKSQEGVACCSCTGLSVALSTKKSMLSIGKCTRKGKDKQVTSVEPSARSSLFSVSEDNSPVPKCSCAGPLSSHTSSPFALRTPAPAASMFPPPVPTSPGFSKCTASHIYIGIPASLLIVDLEAVHTAASEAHLCLELLKACVEMLEKIEQLKNL